jgi:hypothetical protein
VLNVQRHVRQPVGHEALEHRNVQLVAGGKVERLHLWPQLLVVANKDHLAHGGHQARQDVRLKNFCGLLYN